MKQKVLLCIFLSGFVQISLAASYTADFIYVKENCTGTLSSIHFDSIRTDISCTAYPSPTLETCYQEYVGSDKVYTITRCYDGDFTTAASDAIVNDRFTDNIYVVGLYSSSDCSVVSSLTYNVGQDKCSQGSDSKTSTALYCDTQGNVTQYSFVNSSSCTGYATNFSYSTCRSSFGSYYTQSRCVVKGAVPTPPLPPPKEPPVPFNSTTYEFTLYYNDANCSQFFGYKSYQRRCQPLGPMPTNCLSNEGISSTFGLARNYACYTIQNISDLLFQPDQFLDVFYSDECGSGNPSVESFPSGACLPPLYSEKNDYFTVECQKDGSAIRKGYYGNCTGEPISTKTYQSGECGGRSENRASRQYICATADSKFPTIKTTTGSTSGSETSPGVTSNGNQPTIPLGEESENAASTIIASMALLLIALLFL